MSETAPLGRLNPANPEYITRKVFPAGDWALDEPENTRAVVGRGQQILWADGESLLIVGDTGHGKSTLSQNIVRANIGLIQEILGMTAKAIPSILYIAADRPSQIKYSLKRMVNESNRQMWNEHVYVHHGPLDFPLNDEPFKLAPFIRETAEKLDREPFGAVVIDSLKDCVSQMDDNEDGIHINQAIQSVSRLGVQVIVDMHPRKLGSDRGKVKVPILDDVSGNKNITGGAGSVLFIGMEEKGAHPLFHLKSPSEPIVDMGMRFDRVSGDVSYFYYGLEGT